MSSIRQGTFQQCRAPKAHQTSAVEIPIPTVVVQCQPSLLFWDILALKEAAECSLLFARMGKMAHLLISGRLRACRMTFKVMEGRQGRHL